MWFLALLSPYRWLLSAGLVAALGVGAWYLHHTIDQGGYDRAKNEYTALALKASEQARSREQELTVKASLITKDKDEKISNINARLAVAIGRLRDRPERTSAANSNSSNCKGVSGAELSRPDAEFLNREAARADSIRAALSACYEQYESITPLK